MKDTDPWNEDFSDRKCDKFIVVIDSGLYTSMKVIQINPAGRLFMNIRCFILNTDPTPCVFLYINNGLRE